MCPQPTRTISHIDEVEEKNDESRSFDHIHRANEYETDGK